MAFVRWIVVAVVFVALLYLSLLNSQPARLTFFNVATWEAPLVVVVFIAFACGVAAGLLAGALRTSRLKRQLNKLRREHHAAVGEPLVLPAGAPPGTSPASGPGFER
ncbi:MAG TPA: LapA family protein [Casimicrobiaceae bacterium]|nr:LapA family protein [Casimicrobiaceae bacterium]